MLQNAVAIFDANFGNMFLYEDNAFRTVVAGVELGGIRTLLAVPMLKEGHLVGAIVIYRKEYANSARSRLS
jgi:GAF domain-containing protein